LLNDDCVKSIRQTSRNTISTKMFL
jgi:hypothetical protein